MVYGDYQTFKSNSGNLVLTDADVIKVLVDENKNDDAYSNVKTYLACGNSDTREYDYLTDEYFPINYYYECFFNEW